MIHVDTHVLVWLYFGEVESLTKTARELIEAEDVVASPMTILEMDLLHEIGRIDATGKEVVEDLAERVGLRLSETPFARVVESARALRWTRDPFDRIIVASAIADASRFLAKDKTILLHFDGAVWDSRTSKRRRK